MSNGLSCWRGMQWALPLMMGLLVGMTACAQGEEQDLKAKLRAALLAEDCEAAVPLLTKVIEEEPENAAAWYRRGCEHFRCGKFKESVQDFDQYVKLEPTAERRLWERGISCYYAKMYQEGADQFALYQTYHDNDVENSVWRMMCMVQTVGLEKAREQMLPIKNDSRIPLMKIYALFQGKSTPDEVRAAAMAGSPAKEDLDGQLFYAQFYLGLYYEATGQPELAKQYITQAWKDHEQTRTISRYMWHVAKVHAKLLGEKREE